MAYQSSYTGAQIDEGIGKTQKMTASGNDIAFAGKVTVGSQPESNMDAVNLAYLQTLLTPITDAQIDALFE